MIDLEEFGRQLTIFRLAAGFPTHEAAAEATGVERSRISRHESGTGGKPQRDTLARYESAYHLPAGSLSRVLIGEKVPVPAVSTAFTITAPVEAPVPRHARNLPLAVREYLAELRLRLTKGGAAEEEIDEAMELLRSPQVFTFYKGGAPSEYNEEDVLRGMKAIAEGVIIPELRDRGRKIK